MSRKGGFNPNLEADEGNVFFYNIEVFCVFFGWIIGPIVWLDDLIYKMFANKKK